MTRPLLLLSMAVLTTGCCSMDPMSGAWSCREGLTGVNVGWHGLRENCSGTLFDGRRGLVTDRCGPNGRFAMAGCGIGQCGVGQCGGGQCGGGDCGCGGLFDGGTSYDIGFGSCGCETDCGASAGYGVGYGSVVQPLCDQCGMGGDYGIGPVIGGMNVVPGPAYGAQQTPLLTPPTTMPPQYVAPVVPAPQAYPTGVTPAPQAATPPVIQNTYSWRTRHHRS